MAQQARTQQRERQALTIAPRMLKPADFNGTDATWRGLCDQYPAAETPEIIQALFDYCAMRKLDPLRHPVHIVPMYNTKLRRKVQTIMQGINEIEVTASRSKVWAGMDPPIWGPEETTTFTGSFERDDGTTENTTVKMTYPVWCRLTVYRLVAGEARKFTEELFWRESYGRAGFRSEIPNARWQQAPRQMLHKCTKAAVLRAAFPDADIPAYVAEEMDGQETETGGITIEGKIDQGGEPVRTERGRYDRTAGEPDQGKPSDAADLDALLDQDSNLGLWLKNLEARLKGATSLTEVIDIGGKPSVARALREAPSLIIAQIKDMLRKAHERLAEPPPHDPDDPGAGADEGSATDEDLAKLDAERLAELLAEIEASDQFALKDWATSAVWRSKLRALAPHDEETATDAIAARLALLKGESKP